MKTQTTYALFSTLVVVDLRMSKLVENFFS